MPEKKEVSISASVEGFEQVKTPLKAVAYSEEADGIKILGEKKVGTGKFEIRVSGAPDKQPETVNIAVVPEDLTTPSLIKRFVQAGYGPHAAVKKDLMRAREGRIVPADIPLKFKPELIPFWPPLMQTVCGRVIKRDPVTGAECPVPGATVTVLDVDLNFLWYYPHFGFPWGWIYPFWLRREKIATVKTDECGKFCVKIPRFDIDAILRWRLRLHCLWEILKPPLFRDVLELGITPDFDHYPDLRTIADRKRFFRVKPKKIPDPDPDPLAVLGLNASAVSPALRASALAARNAGLVSPALSNKMAAFRPAKTDSLPVLERMAFPKQVPALPLPDNTRLAGIVHNEKMIADIRRAQPIVRLVRCWKEIVPELQLFLDVPDIVFRVEQDIDGDGALETIYDQGYFDVNWNLSSPTTNVVIEAWNNAICIPCGTSYKPCTASGIVTINEMPVEAALISPDGYARTINRPRPDPTIPPKPVPDAQTPFDGPLRLSGCPEYGTKAGSVKYYRMYYIFENDPAKKKTYFRESWTVWEIGTVKYPTVAPDLEGYYEAEYASNKYAPYHTLMNWRTGNYPDGKYQIGLELYNAAKKQVPAVISPVHIIVDNSHPYPVEFTSFQYREGGTGSWNTLPLNCAVIQRTPGSALELKVQINVAATHLRDIDLALHGCDTGLVIPCDTTHPSYPNCSRWTYWHKTVNDNNVSATLNFTVPAGKQEGGYYFYLEARSRATDAYGGISVNWEMSDLDIWTPKTMTVAIIDKKTTP